MGKASGKTYSPVPARAMGADRLTSLDCRALMAIAFHDRLGANGTGCFASPARLAQLTGSHTKSLLRSVGVLKAAGLIDIIPNPMDRRRHVYKIVYSPFDAEFTKGNGNRGGYQLPAEISNPSEVEFPESVTENRQIGNRDFENIQQDQRLAEVNILEDKIKINTSREAGSEGTNASVTAMLSMLQRMVRNRKDIRPYVTYLRTASTLPGRDGDTAKDLLRIAGGAR